MYKNLFSERQFKPTEKPKRNYWEGEMKITIFLSTLVLVALILSPALSFAERDSLCMCMVDAWSPPNLDCTYGMAILGNYLLFPHRSLYILEIGNSGELNLVSTVPESNHCYNVVVKDTIAYVATGEGLICLDVSNPTSPDSIGYLRGYNFLFLEIVDTLVYISSLSDLFIVNVSNPTIPTVVESLYGYGGWDIFVDYPYLYAVSGPSAPHSLAVLGILDVENPDSVILTGVFEHDGDVDDFYRYLSVVVDDTIIYICGQEPAITVLATNSSRDSVWFVDGWDNCVYPLPWGPYSAEGGIYLIDSTKLVASRYHDLWVMDISNPSDIHRIAYYAGDGVCFAQAIAVKDSFIFVSMVSGGGDGVGVFKYPCGCGDGNSEIDVVPDNFDIDIYPNPFNTACKIDFNLPNSPDLSVAIYNIKSQMIDEFSGLSGGKGSIVWDASDCPSGIYLVCATSNNIQLVKKVLFIE